jgi:hypothetical protein
MNKDMIQVSIFVSRILLITVAMASRALTYSTITLLTHDHDKLKSKVYLVTVMPTRLPHDPSIFELLILVEVRFGGGGRGRGEPEVVAECRGGAGGAPPCRQSVV